MLVNKVLGNGAAVERWVAAAVLVLDEVSMLDSNLASNFLVPS